MLWGDYLNIFENIVEEVSVELVLLVTLSRLWSEQRIQPLCMRLCVFKIYNILYTMYVCTYTSENVN